MLMRRCLRSFLVGAAITAALVFSGCEGENTEVIEPPDCAGVTDIDQLAQCITRDYSTRTERIAAAFLWVRDSFPYELTYHDCKPPARTLADGNGDCCDKATLLAALLYKLGEPSYYIFITCEPTCSHMMLAVEATDHEAAEMSRLTGGQSHWKRAHHGSLRLAIVDATTPNVGYIGYLADDYYVSTGETSWQWTYYTTIEPTWQDPDVLYARRPVRGVCLVGDSR
jgi:hypothetical protein